MLTHSDFDDLSWHDCHIWGLDVVAGAPHENDWSSDLALDIDFILSGRMVGTDVEFSVVPASLVFHGVTRLRLAIDPGSTEDWTAIHPLSIDRLERTVVAERDQRIHLDRPYFRWTIALNWPSDSEITFGAWGFTQTHRGEPVAVRGGRQQLTLRERASSEARGNGTVHR